VVGLSWVFNSELGSDNWWLVSAGSDGKVLFWTLANKLQHPIKGFLINKSMQSGTRRFVTLLVLMHWISDD
jgi:hypothetical protein